MFVKMRLGCIGTAFLVGLVLVVFWRPISRRMTDWTFDQTTEHVVAMLPAGERDDAFRLCERLWSNVREHGIPDEHRERFDEFRKEAFKMLQNNEITEEEARDFIERARTMLETVYPER